MSVGSREPVGTQPTLDASADEKIAHETQVRWGLWTVLRQRISWFVVVLNLTVFFIIWQWFASTELVNPLFLPAPTTVFAALSEGFSTGLFQEHLQFSIRNFIIGMSVACAIGIPIGLLMGASRIIDAIFSPYVWAMASLPRIALVPLLILVFGFSDMMKLVTIFLSAVFPIMINCMAGVKTVEPSLLRAGKVFGASKAQLYRNVVFPYTLPFIISGVNQGMTRGLVGLVIAEIFGGNSGLGFLITRSAESFNSGQLYAVLFMLVVMSLTFVQSLRWFEKRIAPWRNQAAPA